MVPPQNYLAWKACTSILHVAAIGATLLRISIRWKGEKLWWDDHLATAAILVDGVFVVFLWLMFGAKASDPDLVSKLVWLHMVSYYLIFWLSRISLALSIARVFPVGTLPRKILLATAGFFFLLFLSTSVLNPVLCVGTPLVLPPAEILLPAFGNCQPGKFRYLLAGGISIAAEFSSDLLSIVIPMTLLWCISLPPKERRLVHGTILATILGTLCGIVTCVFWYAPLDLGVDYRVIAIGVLYIQAAMSLIICNLLVVVTYWWRKAYRRNRPIPRRYRHNDPNITSSKTSPPRSFANSGSQSDEDEIDGPRRTSHLDTSSRLPDDLSFTPITSLSPVSASYPTWRSPAHTFGSALTGDHRAPLSSLSSAGPHQTKDT